MGEPMTSAGRSTQENSGGLYLGWVVGGLLILAIFAVGAAFWFIYHHP